MDPGPVRDRAAVPVRPELVGVRPVGAAVDVLRPGVPVEQLLVVVGAHPLVGVVAQHRRVQPELHRRVDRREVVAPRAPGRCRRGLVLLVRGVEREDRVLRRVGEQSQGLAVFGRVRHQAHGVRVIVVDLFPGHERVGRDVLVLQQLVGGVPEGGDHAVLDAVGERLHLGRFRGVPGQRVGVAGGVRGRPDVRRLGPVQVAGLPVERDRVGVVAGHRAPVVFDHPVVVRVVGGELTLGVALGVPGEVVQHGRLTAVDLVRPPCRLGDVLRVRVRPVLRVARVVDEPAVRRVLPDREVRPVGVLRVPQILQVVDVHRLGQRDRVVVPGRALHRLRELEVLPGDVRVQVVEAHQPPAVVDVLLDRRIRHVDVGDVLGPPPVVRPDVRRERVGRTQGAVGVVVGK